MAKKTKKEKYIDLVLKVQYNDDDPKYYDQNLAYLETLSVEELEKMVKSTYGL